MLKFVAILYAAMTAAVIVLLKCDCSEEYDDELDI